MNPPVRKPVPGGGLNLLAAAAACMPGRGPGLFLGVFGLQVAGAVLATFIYGLRFVMPVVISLGLMLVFMIRGRYGAKGLFCALQKVAPRGERTQAGKYWNFSRSTWRWGVPSFLFFICSFRRMVAV